MCNTLACVRQLLRENSSRNALLLSCCHHENCQAALTQGWKTTRSESLRCYGFMTFPDLLHLLYQISEDLSSPFFPVSTGFLSLSVALYLSGGFLPSLDITYCSRFQRICQALFFLISKGFLSLSVALYFSSGFLPSFDITYCSRYKAFCQYPFSDFSKVFFVPFSSAKSIGFFVCPLDLPIVYHNTKQIASVFFDFSSIRQSAQKPRLLIVQIASRRLHFNALAH